MFVKGYIIFCHIFCDISFLKIFCHLSKTQNFFFLLYVSVNQSFNKKPEHKKKNIKTIWFFSEPAKLKALRTNNHKAERRCHNKNFDMSRDLYHHTKIFCKIHKVRFIYGNRFLKRYSFYKDLSRKYS